MRILFILLLLSLTAPAQTLEEIKAYDRKVQALVDQGGEYPPLYCNSLEVNQAGKPWPAVGIYKARYQFYYDHEDGSAGADPRPDPDRLRKVLIEFDVSSRHYRYELLYNLRGGLILYRDADHEVAFAGGRPLGRNDPALCQKALALGLHASRLFRQSLRFAPE